MRTLQRKLRDVQDENRSLRARLEKGQEAIAALQLELSKSQKETISVRADIKEHDLTQEKEHTELARDLAEMQFVNKKLSEKVAALSLADKDRHAVEDELDRLRLERDRARTALEEELRHNEDLAAQLKSLQAACAKANDCEPTRDRSWRIFASIFAESRTRSCVPERKRRSNMRR